jgi:hypothetical protein
VEEWVWISGRVFVDVKHPVYSWFPIGPILRSLEKEFIALPNANKIGIHLPSKADVNVVKWLLISRFGPDDLLASL